MKPFFFTVNYKIISNTNSHTHKLKQNLFLQIKWDVKTFKNWFNFNGNCQIHSKDPNIWFVLFSRALHSSALLLLLFLKLYDYIGMFVISLAVNFELNWYPVNCFELKSQGGKFLVKTEWGLIFFLANITSTCYTWPCRHNSLQISK